MSLNGTTGPLKSLALETLLVAAVGLGLAFLANQLSPRGLLLSRNYFDNATTPVAASPPSAGSPAAQSTLLGQSATGLDAELQREGFRVVDTDVVVRLHADPRREQGLIVFVDARDESHHQAGHIPGACQLDHFYPERNLAEVLALCTLAEQVVVYCNGGDCTDSHLAARLLKEGGIPAERLAVFVGGIAAWKASRSPVEVGSRDSGDLRRP